MNQKAILIKESLLKKYPNNSSNNNKDNFRCPCPIHDGTDNNFVLYPNGSFKCFSHDCKSLDDLTRILAITIPVEQVTLQSLENSFKIPSDYLQNEFNLKDIKAGVLIPYFSEAAKELTTRTRVKLYGDSKILSKTKSKNFIYGLQKFKTFIDSKISEVLIVEGESDTWVLNYSGLPAIGIPGATQFGLYEEAIKKCIESNIRPVLYIENDDGGKQLLKHLSANADHKDILIIQGSKETNDFVNIWLENPVKNKFRQEIKNLRNSATAMGEIIDEELKEEGEKALIECKDLWENPNKFNLLEKEISIGYSSGKEGPVASLVSYFGLLSSLRSKGEEDEEEERPLRIVFTGGPGSGKNQAINNAVKLIDLEDTVQYTATSDKAFIYNKHTYINKTVIYYEADSIPEEGPSATAFRSLCDGEGCKYEVTQQNPETNNWETKEYFKPGPTGLQTTTTKDFKPQNASRLLEVQCDESAHQTKRVLNKYLRNNPKPDREPWINLYIVIRNLGSKKVDIPFMDILIDGVALFTVTRMRRDFPQLLSLIKTVAMFNQANREITEGVIQAKIEDYDIAKRLLLKTFSLSQSEIDDSGRLVEKIIRALAESGDPALGKTSITINQIMDHEEIKEAGLDRKAIQRRCHKLLGLGIIENEAPGRGRTALYKPLKHLSEECILPELKSSNTEVLF